MDASPSMSERLRELEALRLRAYGPDADIDADPAAMQRLRDLEAESRSAEVPDGTVSSGADQTDAADSAEAAPAVTAAPPTPGAPTDPAQRKRAVRPLTWILVAASLVVGVLVGTVGATVAQPRPTLSLGIDPETARGESNWTTALSAWGMDASSAVPYERYRGAGVWVTSSDEGTRCIILEIDAEPLAARCAAAGLEPILDVVHDQVLNGRLLNGRLEDPLEVDEAARLILRGSVIEVWESGGAHSSSADSSSTARLPSSP